ncbi:hypothetical protein [Aquipseudomonas guryensis]|jgi:hypothetical protein|uniref:Uncharacterized protein n=1 Tax=Aquipseudomonas guryensis TaxID=2759165 RepID=A0A7W4D8K9_9GAMM|nr:hypothetical protein [Pseudomonas guryensis]MBB1517993.1 hypothetical protein [Pseudomonas guryensis]
MQYSTALSDGLLALACLASAIWCLLGKGLAADGLRHTRLYICLGFVVPGITAICGAIRYGFAPDWQPLHSTLSQISSFTSLPILGLAAFSLALVRNWGMNTWFTVPLILLLSYQITNLLYLRESWQLTLNMMALALIVSSAALRWWRPLLFAIASGVVTLFLLAGLVVGTEGFIGSLRRVDLFHGLLSLAYPLLAWLLLRLQGYARAEIPVKTL